MIKTIDYNFFKSLVKPRPTGSKNNNDVIRQIKEVSEQMGFDTEQLDFDCVVWDKDESYLEIDNEKIIINPGPFSPAAKGKADICCIHNVDELRNQNIKDKIVVLKGEIASEPISPKDFPYYYPDNHKEINDLLEAKQPLAVIAVTGKHPMCGLNPYPMFEDGNFSIPSAYISQTTVKALEGAKEGTININSVVSDSKSSQLIIRKMAKSENSETIIICAHVDTAYNTPGALDNAAGLAVMMQIMESLKDKELEYNFEFVPFNGEDYFDITGQRTYIEKYPISGRNIKLVMNIDDAGHIGSKNALSTYNIDENTEGIIQSLIKESDRIVKGAQWHESDHAMFIQNNIQAIVFASSDLLETTVELTHTLNDTVDAVDYGLIESMSEFAVRLFHQLGYVK